MAFDSLKNLLDLNKIEFRENESMSGHTSFKIGGKADLFVLPSSENELCLVLNCVKKENIPFFILGNGSNLLVSDKGIEGAVISIAKMNKIELLGEDEIYAEAGTSLAAICHFCKEKCAFRLRVCLRYSGIGRRRALYECGSLRRRNGKCN